MNQFFLQQGQLTIVLSIKSKRKKTTIKKCKQHQKVTTEKKFDFTLQKNQQQHQSIITATNLKEKKEKKITILSKYYIFICILYSYHVPLSMHTESKVITTR